MAYIRERDGQEIADETEGFKIAYVAAAIRASGNKQFHMRHSDYSIEVQKPLDTMAQRLEAVASGVCPEVKVDKDGKIDPPMGLPEKLDGLSGNLRRLVAGKVWRSPIFTDKLTEQYAKEKLTKTLAQGEVVSVKL